MSAATWSHETFIRDARRLLNPTPVRIGHVPNWFRRAVLKVYGRRWPYGTSGHDVVSNLQPDGWLDHWGSTVLHNGSLAFVSEPYHLSAEEHQAIEYLAKAIDCWYGVSSDSWWYPAHTLRIAFWQKEERLKCSGTSEADKGT